MSRIRSSQYLFGDDEIILHISFLLQLVLIPETNLKIKGGVRVRVS